MGGVLVLDEHGLGVHDLADNLEPGGLHRGPGLDQVDDCFSQAERARRLDRTGQVRDLEKWWEE